MGEAAWLCLGLAGLVAAADWVAVATARKRLEYVCKPGVMVALIGATASLHPAVAAQQRWWLVALALGLSGDVFLMLPRSRFVAGLTAFLLGHLAYIAGFIAAGVTPMVALVYVLAVLLVVSVVLPRVVVGALDAQQRAMVAPLMVYALVIAVMVGFALAGHSRLAAAGAALFLVSDGLIAYRRFVTNRGWMRVAIIITYHLGQVGLVLSLAR